MFAISFAVYTLAIVAVGVVSARRASDSNEDYFLAGRSLGPWVAAFSASASSESGWVTLGLVGWAFTSGVSAYWIIPGCLLGYLFNWLVIAPRLRVEAARTGAITLPDVLAFRFGERKPILRTLTVLVILVAMWMYVAAQFAATGKAFESAFASVDYRLGVVLGAAIVLVYTVVGGFRAACWTDFVQAILMLVALALFPALVLVRQGGYGFVHEALAAKPDLLAWIPSAAQASGAALVGFLLGHGALGINFGYPGQPHVLVRFMAMRDPRAARAGAVIAVAWGAIVYWGAVTIGLVLRAMVERGVDWTAPLAAELAAGQAGAGETGLVFAAKHLLPGLLSGAVLAAVLAAMCSTADSQLVVAASAGANDLWGRILGRSGTRGALLLNRVVLLALGLLAMLAVLQQKVQVFTFVLTYGWAVLGAAIGPQVILALLWSRASYAGCIAGMVTGFGVAVAWPNLYDEGATGVHVYNLPLAFLAALAVNVGTSLVVGGRAAPRDAA